MAWDEAFTCDLCGKIKRETNHWWMVKLGDADHCEDDQPSRSLILLPWNLSDCRDKCMIHLCGAGCATKALERFMSTGTVLN